MLCIWKKCIFILLQSLSKYLGFLFIHKSFIWIIDVCSILPHWAIYLGIIVSIMRKNIQTKPSERRKPDFWAQQTLNAWSNRCLLQELQVLKKKFLESAEKLSFCWLIPIYHLFLAGMVDNFLKSAGLIRSVFIRWQFVFQGQCLLCPFYPCYKKTMIEWFCLWDGTFE